MRRVLPSASIRAHRPMPFALALALVACRASEPSAPDAHGFTLTVPPDLAAAEAAWKEDPTDEQAIIWYGRRTAYEGRYEEAVAIYGEGLRTHPASARLLRHRGHRNISLRRFGDARADLERAAALLAGTPDEIELDGQPNAYGIPRSTLHTNVWYHLGLAHHFLGEDASAAEAFARCLAIAPNDDMRVAAAWWRALALVHLGRIDEARALARVFAERELELMESHDYGALLALLAGTSDDAVERLGTADGAVAHATLGYGVAMAHLASGRTDEARRALEALTAGPSSAAFGRIAAEVELARLADQDDGS